MKNLEPFINIRNLSFSIQGDIEENTEGLDLGSTIELLFDMEFDNFYSLGGGYFNINTHFSTFIKGFPGNKRS